MDLGTQSKKCAQIVQPRLLQDRVPMTFGWEMFIAIRLHERIHRTYPSPIALAFAKTPIG